MAKGGGATEALKTSSARWHSREREEKTVANVAYFKYPWKWEDRTQYLELPFPMSEYERRIAAVKAEMEKDRLDCLLIVGDVRERGNIRYLSNFYALLGHSILILPLDDEPVLVTSAAAHGEPMHSFVPETWVKDVRAALFHDLPPDPPTVLGRTREVLVEKHLSRARIGIVGWHLLGYDYFSGLKQSFPGIEWSDWLRPYELVKAVKSELELKVMERAAEAADAGMRAAFEAAKPGVTELEVAGAFEYGMRKAGIETVAYLFDTRVCSGPRSPLKNGNPTSRRLQPGDMIFMDISATYHGYVVDAATSSVVGGDPTKEQLSLLETAARMTETLVASSKPGTPVPDLVEAVRNVAEEMGEGSTFIDYIVGHGLGCSQLEVPHCHPNSPDVLAAGMVFSLEPMVVCPIRGTGTIERVCAVETSGGRLLSKFPLRPWTLSW